MLYDMWLVDGIDPFSQILLYLIVMSFAWWFGGELTREPMVVPSIGSVAAIQEVMPEMLVSEPSQTKEVEQHIALWDDPEGSTSPVEVDGGEEVEQTPTHGASDMEGAVMIAQEGQEKQEEENQRIDLSTVQVFKLRKKDVVRVADLALSIPVTIRRYQLHKKPVVRVADLREAQLVI